MKIINHKFNGLMIAQRRHDGYIKNITAANFIDSIPVVTEEVTVRFTVDLRK